MPESTSGSSGQTARTNIDQVVQLEDEAERNEPPFAKWSEKAGAFAGTLSFIAIHLVLVAVWIGLNGGIAISQFKFDPFPYPLLAAVFSFQSVLLTSFVLIRQTRMSERADRRSHLDLQINLLAEKEMTKSLRMLQAICGHLGLKAVDSELLELSKDTVVKNLAQDIRTNLKEETQR